MRGELGRGGMGRVDEAFDRALGRPVALKHMLATSAVDLARFEREARITARLEHPGIVPIHDAGRSADGTPYYVMRRIDGEPLDELVAGKPFEARLALVPNVLAACDAAAFAHAQSVIHRDIKPTNILIGPFGETLLIDWGLARTIGEATDTDVIPASDPSLTRAGMVAGTPGFMAPEQARGETVDARADVFALGATLFYVLSGQLPYASTGATEMIDHVGAGRPPDWRRLPDETPPDLRAIVMKAMASERDERYRDAGALAADLRRFVSGKLVGAYEYGLLEQLRRFLRRHRAAVAVGVVALVVIGIGATLFVRRIVQERDDANLAREIAEQQRREARSTGDRLLVQHALQLAATDPAAAVVELRQLGPDSTEWDRASIVAAKAAARGIPFGFSTDINVGDLDASPDSRHIAYLGMKHEHIQVFDLITRTSRTLPPSGIVHTLRWLDARWLSGIGDGSLVLLDTQTERSFSIPVPMGVKAMHTNHQAQLWIVSDKGDVYSITPETRELPPPMLLGVEDFLPLGPERGVIERKHALELSTPTGTTVITTSQNDLGDSVVLVAEDHVAAQIREGLCLWDLHGAPVKVSCAPSVGLVPIAVRGDAVYAAGITGVIRISRDGTTLALDRGVGLPSRTEHGLLISRDTGEIIIDDAQGWFELGAQPLRYRRMIETLDARFVVAATTTGELLAWDLPTFRPKLIEIDHGETMFGIDRHSLWTYLFAGGVYRYDRATGAKEMIFDTLATGATMGDDWVMVYSRINEKTLIYDVVGGRTQELEAGAIALVVGVNLVVVDPTGGVFRVDGAGVRTKIGAFPAAPTLAAASLSSQAARLSDGRLCRRFDRSGEVTCTKLAREPREIEITATGVVFALIGDELWRWDGTGAPAQVPTSQPISTFQWSGDELVATASTELLVLTTGQPRSVTISPMEIVTAGTSKRLIGRTPQGSIAPIDLETGMSFELVLGNVLHDSFSVSDGTTVATATGGTSASGRTSVLLWELPVPTDRAGLQRWLADVTNAKALPGRDVVAWP